MATQSHAAASADNHLSNTDTPVTARFPVDFDGVVTDLWGRVYESLTKEELERFSSATEEAALYFQNLEEVISGIGCLVGDDRITGMFQSKESVSTLLFFLSSSIGSASALMRIGCEAEYRLRNRG
jgi:hypothetical protein